MADPILPAQPWYTSKVYIGAITTVLSQLVVLAPKAAAAVGITSSDDLNATVTAVFQTIALVAGAYTAVARANSPVAPLTVTQAQADAHPNTAASKEPPK